MGSGKSYWGKLWGETFSLDWYDLDTEIEKATGKTIDAIFKEEGELDFRKKERQVFQVMKSKRERTCGKFLKSMPLESVHCTLKT
jgi:shikimate kinase